MVGIRKKMDKSGHLIVGFVMGISFIFLSHYFFNWFSYNLNFILIYAAIIFIYCLLPDLDSKSSTIVWLFIGISIIGMCYGFYASNKPVIAVFLILLVITYVSAQFMSHRGFIHSILFGILVSVPLFYLFDYQTAILGFLCFYSHLLADEEFFKII